MRCPAEIADILVALLERGLLRIRALGWEGRAEPCAVEADHLHNLPALLADFSRERLVYYWQIERASYIDRLTPDDVSDWEPLWRRLEPYVVRPEILIPNR